MKTTKLLLLIFLWLWAFVPLTHAVNKVSPPFKHDYLVQLKTMSGKEVEGELVALNDNEVVLLQEGKDEVQRYPSESIKKLRIHRRKSFAKSMLIGGVVSGVLATGLTGASLGNAEIDTRRLFVFLGVVTLLGAVFLGTFIYLFKKTRFTINGKQYRFEKFRRKFFKKDR